MKSMDPKKAKLAIIITVVVALLILALCLCMLLDVQLFGKKAEPTPTPVIVETTPKPTPVPAKPSEADLAGTSEMLQHPAPENYLDSYRTMVTRTASSNVNGQVYMLLNTKPWEYEYEIVAKLDGNTQVTAIAQENGYTLVLYKEGVAGWIKTTELDDFTG